MRDGRTSASSPAASGAVARDPTLATGISLKLESAAPVASTVRAETARRCSVVPPARRHFSRCSGVRNSGGRR